MLVVVCVDIVCVLVFMYVCKCVHVLLRFVCVFTLMLHACSGVNLSV